MVLQLVPRGRRVAPFIVEPRTGSGFLLRLYIVGPRVRDCFRAGDCGAWVALPLAKTSSATKHGAILGSEDLNTVSIALTEHGGFGRRDPRAPATHVYIRAGGKLVRNKPVEDS
jgi:hypothetical protein